MVKASANLDADAFGARHRALLAHPKTIVMKVGSALLVDDIRGQVRRSWLEALAAEMTRLRGQGHRLVLVSSGAIRVGLQLIGRRPDSLTLADKQAAAALGQVKLAQVYAEVFDVHDWRVGQMLLTAGDTETRRRYVNARDALERLAEMGALPLVNENDSVSTGEMRFGDNDQLAARVAGMISADLLYLFSDIDGLYSANPKTDPAAKHIAQVDGQVSQEIMAMAGAVSVGYSSGGMVTKLKAAQIALGAGCDMVIADGRAQDVLARLDAGERFTLFCASQDKMLGAAKRQKPRSQWLTSAIKLRGRVVVDRGAASALRAGKSLLPAGVRGVEGVFERGDVVAIVSEAGEAIGRGIALYDSTDAVKIAGHNSAAIENLLGFSRGNVLIHAGDLATY